FILLAFAAAGFGQNVYTGEAVVARVNVLGILNASIQDTGQLPADGGSLSTELASVNVPNLLDLHLLSASTDGPRGQTEASASATQVALSVAGINITASILTSKALATCGGVSGTSTIVGLKVNGLSVRVTGAPNQTVPLLVGSLILNEQISSTSDAM